MAIFQTFLKRLFNKGDTSSSETVDHYEHLEKLRRNHDWLQVSLTKSNRSYQSLIINIDVENHELLIDDLYPPEDLEHIEAGDTVAIQSQSKRNPVSFYTRVLAKEFIDGERCWRLELPEEVGLNHSRSAFRVYVENEPSLEIELYIEDQALDNVRIINLSSEGLKLSFDEADTAILEKNRLFENSIIRLPTDEDIDCTIQLSNLYRIRTPHPHTLGGGKLTVSNAQQRVKLQQYIAAVQRKQRRRETRDN